MSNKAQRLAANKQKRKLKRNKAKIQVVAKKAQKTNLLDAARQAAGEGHSLLELANLLVDSGHRAKGGEVPKNDEILRMIGEITGQVVILHAGVEIIERVLKEQGKVFTEAEQAIADNIDRGMVKLSEDVNVILAFIDEGKTMEDYLQIFLHMTDLVQEMQTTQMYGVNEHLIKAHTALLREFLQEHMEENQDAFVFSIPYHDDRINRIAHLYRTQHTVKGEGDILAPLMMASEEELFGADAEVDESVESLAEEPPAAPIQ